MNNPCAREKKERGKPRDSERTYHNHLYCSAETSHCCFFLIRPPIASKSRYRKVGARFVFGRHDEV